MAVSIGGLRQDQPFFSIVVTLDAVSYTLQFRWNVRAAAWFVTVLDAVGVNVLLGDTRVVANFPLALYVTGRAPSGLLMAVDTSGQGLDPGLTDLGDRIDLQYFSKAELGLT